MKGYKDIRTHCLKSQMNFKKMLYERNLYLGTKKYRFVKNVKIRVIWGVTPCSVVNR
jgi:hypothetical protein